MPLRHGSRVPGWRADQLTRTLSSKTGPSSACTCSRVAPGSSRPIISSHHTEIGRTVPMRDNCAAWARGSVMSVVSVTLVPSKPARVTPTTVNGTPFTRSVFPTMPASPR